MPRLKRKLAGTPKGLLVEGYGRQPLRSPKLRTDSSIDREGMRLSFNKPDVIILRRHRLTHIPVSPVADRDDRVRGEIKMHTTGDRG